MAGRKILGKNSPWSNKYNKYEFISSSNMDSTTHIRIVRIYQIHMLNGRLVTCEL